MRNLLVAALLTTPAFADVFADLKPGEWYEVPNSKLVSVAPNPAPEGSVTAVMEAWSGGAYDSKRDQLLIWGGGHGDYAGNEVYGFSISTLKWTRLTNPSANTGGDEASGTYPDGSPRSRHTYNYIQYVPAIDRFCTLGGAGQYPSGQIGTNKTFCLDLDAKKWEQKANAVSPNIGAISGYDQATGRVWLQGTADSPDLSEWDPVGNKWVKHVRIDAGWFDYNYTAAIGEGKMLAVGQGHVWQWDLSKPDQQPVDLKTTGATDIVSKNNPGLVYDPVSKRFVAWAGGATVYTLDLAKKSWSTIALAATNKVTPSAADPRGTYGRFQYIPSKNAFIGVNRTDGNVYLFKMNSEAPQPVKLGAPRGFLPRLPGALPSGDGWILGMAPGDPLRAVLGEAPSVGYRVYSVDSRTVAAVGNARATWEPAGLRVGSGSFARLPAGAYVLEVEGRGLPVLRQGFTAP
jgi:hypothetical protein